MKTRLKPESPKEAARADPCCQPGGLGLGAFLAAPVLLAGGWIAYSTLAIDHELNLPKALDADRRTFVGPRSGVLSYYVAPQSSGRPLVLLHAINAAGSAYEVRPLFHHYQGTRPVFALDWPGFGFSERSDRVYSPQLYQDALLDFLGSEVKEPADVVALSLASEFAARAAVARPDVFHSLTLISPSGFVERGAGRASQQWEQTGQSNGIYRAFSFPVWGRAFFDLIASRPSIHFFLQQSFEGPVDAGLEEYAYITSHQPGGHYAPLYFVSGLLFTPDVAPAIYERVGPPVQVVYDRDAFVRFDLLPGVLERHPNWGATRLEPTKGLPHFEKPLETFAALDRFWARLD